MFTCAYSGYKQQHQPTIDALLKWKQKQHISNRDWGAIIDLFELKDASVHYIQKRKDQLANEISITSKLNAYKPVAFIELKQYLKEVFARQPPKDALHPIPIKIAIDGGGLTTGKQAKSEIGKKFVWIIIKTNLMLQQHLIC